MKKKGFLLATSAGLAAAAIPGGAQAADMAVKAPRAVVPVATWTGWYIGAHAGAAWTEVDATFLDDPFYNASKSKTGFIGGGQIGYNWQSGNVVFGIEADISGLSSKASTTDQIGYFAYESSIRWLSTVRGRLGFTITPNTMIYATGGVAFGGVKNTLSIPGLVSYSESKTKTGWTVGGGIEHMLSRNWTVGVEGLFVDLGSTTVLPGFAKATRFKNEAIIGRVKLNYKF
jgi:outer membrane immunogenic protein